MVRITNESGLGQSGLVGLKSLVAFRRPTKPPMTDRSSQRGKQVQAAREHGAREGDGADERTELPDGVRIFE